MVRRTQRDPALRQRLQGGVMDRVQVFPRTAGLDLAARAPSPESVDEKYLCAVSEFD